MAKGSKKLSVKRGAANKGLQGRTPIWVCRQWDHSLWQAEFGQRQRRIGVNAMLGWQDKKVRAFLYALKGWLASILSNVFHVQA